MKKAFLLIFIGYFTFGKANSQTFDYPKGTYMSFEEIIKKSPSSSLNLTLIKRTKGDIKMNGGNDYKLTSTDSSTPKKKIKKEIFAFSKGDTLYLNCYHYRVQKWYAAVVSDRKYLVFKGGISQNQDEYQNQMQMGSAFGAIGGAISGAKLATMRFAYIIDKKFNTIRTVDSEVLSKLLSKDEKLASQYDNEVNKEDTSVIIEYLKLINN